VCIDDSSLGPEFNASVCRWWWSGEGLLYQVLAGPVFNNLYPIAGVFTGFLADLGSRKVFLVISLVFWSIATGLTGFAQTYWHLVVLRALLAIGAAGCSPFALSIIGDYFPTELRGTAIGIYYFGIYIGYSLSFAIGNSIAQTLGWRWVFFISGIAGVAVAPIVLFTVREPERKSNKTKTDAKTKPDDKISLSQRFFLLLVTFIMPGMFVLCLAGSIRNAGGYVWAYNTQIFFEKFYSKDTIRNFMSWIPLVGGSLGAVFGGVISDALVKGRGPVARIWVLFISQVAAAPFAAGALFLPYPWCFLSLIPSNIIGEMWIGVTSAIIVDLAPAKIRTASLGLYLFIITVIGGNFNLLVSPITNGFEHHLGKILSLRLTLLLTFPTLYVIGSALFLLSFFLMKIDLRLKPEVEHYILTPVSQSRPGEGEEGEDGKKVT
jgi:MFS family permease